MPSDCFDSAGVEGVKADAGNGKLTVMGKLDPWKLRDRVEAKTHKKVDLVSPANFPKKGADANDPSSSSAKMPAAVKKPDDKKPQDKASRLFLHYIIVLLLDSINPSFLPFFHENLSLR